MTRLLRISLLFAISFTFLGCCQTGSMDTTYPHLEEGKSNARLAMIYANARHYQQAAECFTLSLHQAPRDPEVLDTLALFTEQRGQTQLAEQYYFNALLFNPSSAQARTAYSGFLYRLHRDEQRLFYARDLPKNRK
jgi:Tfp pilus assembly protein PilF